MTKPISAINNLVSRRPTSAVKLKITKKSIARSDVVCTFTAEDVDQIGSKEVTSDIEQQCYDWADQEKRETSFIGEWLNEEGDVVKSLGWHVFPDNAEAGVPNDGSVESMLATQQAMLKELHQYSIDLTKLVGAVLEGTQKRLLERISELESERAETLALKEDLIVEAAQGDEFQKENMDKLMTLAEKIIVAKMSK